MKEIRMEGKCKVRGRKRGKKEEGRKDLERWRYKRRRRMVKGVTLRRPRSFLEFLRSCCPKEVEGRSLKMTSEEDT